MNALAKVERPKPTFKPNRKQPAANKLLFGPAGNVLLEGGSRSGKTFIWVRGIVNRALRASGSRHAIWRKHFNHAKASIGRDTFPKVMRFCFPDLYGKVEFDNEGVAVFPNGAEIWLAGLDDADRVEKVLGQEFATNGFNEISTISYHAVEIAQSRLAQKVMVDRDADFNPLPPEKQFVLPLKAFYDLNPAGKRHWGYQMFHLLVKPGTREPLPDPEEYQFLEMNPDDNRENLPEKYFKILASMTEAKRRRFEQGLWANDIEGALWADSVLDACRCPDATPDNTPVPMERIVIGVDPSGAKPKPGEDIKNNDIGIVVVGLGADRNGYVLEDATMLGGPSQWAAMVVQMYDKWQADLVVAELNYGGAMVESTLQTARDTLPIKMVQSSRGKAVRAEPIAAMYVPTSPRRIFHAGYFGELEGQMASMMPQPIGYLGDGSPDRMDAMVFAATEIMLGDGYHLGNLD